MSTPTGANNPYPGVIPLSKDYRRLQAGSLAKKQEQLVVDKSDGDITPSLAERVAIIEVDGLGWTRAKSTLEQPSVAEKLISIEDGIDDTYEQLSNKYIPTPYIGAVHPGATLLIPLSPESNIKLWAKEFGLDGENITMEITQATDPSIDFSVDQSGLTLTAILGTDENGDPVPVTAAEFKAAWEALDEFNAIARIQSIAESISEYSVEPMVETHLAVGENPSVRLTATAQELNDTVAKAPASGAPTLAVAAKAIATFGAGAEPAEGDTITIGVKTYRFRDKSLGDAVAAHGEWTDSTNTLTVTFASASTSGNGFKVNLIDPGAETANTTAVLNVDGVTIDVTLSNSAVPAINATLAGVKAAIEANSECNALVSCAITGAGTTVIDDTDITLDGGIDAEQPNDVFSGGSAEIAIDNLVTAITTGYTSGVVGTGTVAHTQVTAVKKDSDKMTCTAIISGDDGNLISIAASVGGDITWDETGFLDGGVDGTVAPAGAMRFASGELWVSVEESTISESHWQKATLT